MKKYIVLVSLALVTMSGAVAEGLVENLSPHVIQVNGILTIICAGTFTIWMLKSQIKG